MQEALKILEAFGREFWVSAEVASLISLMRQYARLTGRCSGVGMVLDTMESAVGDLLARAATFQPESPTAGLFHRKAIRLGAYIDGLRALGCHPMTPGPNP